MLAKINTYARHRFARLRAARSGPGCRLPFADPPPLWCYGHHAMVTGIASEHPRLRPLLFNNYINLRCPPSLPSDLPKGFRILTFDPSPDLEKLAWSGVLRQTFEEDPDPRQAAARIGAAILGGSYVVALADTFFIPNSTHFLARPFPHWIILTGFSAQGGCFACSTYCGDGSFRRTTVSAGLLRDALFARSVEALATPARNRRIQYFSVNAAHGGGPPDPRRVAAQLEDYLSGVSSYNKYEPGFNYSVTAPPEIVYGIASLQVVREHFRAAMRAGEPLDPRATRLLQERAALMRQRFALLPGGAAAGADEIGKGLQEVLNLAMALHLTAVEHNLAPRRESPVWSEAEALIDGIVKAEARWLPRVIAQINRHLP